ncbi:hypothetical protein H072_4787 [Dactylellina haptotyla CBS 200.50]|uniref:Uncharacterized protein n=1 Tax=Dactylellina haptotyla (strain CBS 200.50) TaxID=1284197 RepID=S8AEI8_DACHA|nr:hypothetical protein H072_4787 [Dactylellina haptotyla CBS 200.50]
MVCSTEFVPYTYKLAFFRKEANSRKYKIRCRDSHTSPTSESGLFLPFRDEGIDDHHAAIAMYVFLDILNTAKSLKEYGRNQRWYIEFLYMPPENFWFKQPWEFCVVFRLKEETYPYPIIPGLRDIVGDVGISDYDGHELEGYLV